MRNVIAFFVLWLALIIQSTLFQIPPIRVLQPNLVLVVLMVAAMTRGPRAAMVLGVLIGLIQDVMFSSFVGLNAFTYGVIGYFAAATFSQFLQRNFSIAFMITVVFTFIQMWITFGMTRLFNVTGFSWNTVLADSLSEMIQNGIALLVFYRPLVAWFTGKPRGRYRAKESRPT
ncbi:rod shape-determining protein MreD [Alicyclobacillus cycloheptanicus]|uniref:Rod shape-determining protein MreD n=1 Tax=Alicyclobacillus cycloheptanicus TaxID=1457 RepID=A0ABT9XDE4_9BACL|nr:rod shape-determining protein MreD [Alicyclobacillus cycloheptanicus]MDQ0188320.1 rod shape-determining protein MreD [Alicyclobacillus cycloheptanicus]WDM01034.1 rod shape-determining protein MreD [Alicyclobacillus cycloheptanicus]